MKTKKKTRKSNSKAKVSTKTKEQITKYQEKKDSVKYDKNKLEDVKLSGSLNNDLLKGTLGAFVSKGEGSKSTEGLSSVVESKLSATSPIGKSHWRINC